MFQEGRERGPRSGWNWSPLPMFFFLMNPRPVSMLPLLLLSWNFCTSKKTVSFDSFFFRLYLLYSIQMKLMWNACNLIWDNLCEWIGRKKRPRNQFFYQCLVIISIWYMRIKLTRVSERPSAGPLQLLKSTDRFISEFGECWCNLGEWNGLGFLTLRWCSR